MVHKGKSMLSDAELLAILIGTGNRDESAVDLSKRILASVNNSLNDLGKLSLEGLMRFKGIGEAKAVTIASALEIGRRRRDSDQPKSFKITKSKDVFDLLHPMLGELPHEEFWIVYLNNSNTVMQTVQLSKGSITGTLVDVRLVMKKALELGAVSLVLSHNHPSDVLEPSEADLQITKKLKRAASTMDIKVLDHLIITQKDYFSFADEQLI